MPAVGQLLEPRHRQALGAVVDRRRVVAALALADHRLAVIPGRQLQQQPAHVGGDGLAELEPAAVGHSAASGFSRKPVASLGKK